MEILPLVLISLAIIDLTQSTLKDYQTASDYLIEPKKIRKRSIFKHGDEDHSFIEDKLIQHSQALEHLVEMAQRNEELTKKLVENVSKYAEEPKLPERVENSRRSYRKPFRVETNSNQDVKVNPWCKISVLCERTKVPICGYDDNVGYAKFDDMCHMFHVNCYWKYNYSLVPSCHPRY